MSSADSVISKIIELDSQAEAIKADANEKANAICDEYKQLIKHEKENLEREIAKKIDPVNKTAEKKRKAEIENVRKEFSALTQKIEHITLEKIDHIVNDIVAKVKGIIS